MNMEQLTFKVEEKNFTIGTRKYPLKDISQARVFCHSNTDAPATQNHELKRALDRLRFEDGQCYSNANKVVEIGENLGIHIDFYCGWIILGGEVIHHAWNVYDGTLFDVTSSYTTLFNLIRSGLPDMTRTELARLYLELNERRPKTSKDCVWGKVPEEIIYIGCPDTKENATQTISKLMKKFPHHPMKKQMLPSGMTPMQLVTRTQQLMRRVFDENF